VPLLLFAEKMRWRGGRRAGGIGGGAGGVLPALQEQKNNF
jgi:hypothetical protein